MQKFAPAGRLLYCVAMAAVGIQQLFYADYVGMIFPQWPSRFPGYGVLAILFSLALIAGSISILVKRMPGRRVALVMGGTLLLMLLLGQIPYQFIVVPHKKTHLGVWAMQLKELALAGGAFVIAGSLPDRGNDAQHKSALIHSLEKLIPFGRIFFSITMISFGYAHFLYLEGLAPLVPAWIPWHIFWTALSGAGLIAAGIAIMFRIWSRPAAITLGTVIFIWFFIVHIPGTLKHPFDNMGAIITAALSALHFSGTAFVIADDQRKIKRKERMKAGTVIHQPATVG